MKKVVIGIPLYNNARHLGEALESLLLQRYGDFAVVMTDDSATEEVGRIAEEYQKLDPRLVYVRNPVRLGYLKNARKCFELARERFPGMEYFVWGSDHDVWHPRWLEALVAALEKNPDAVLAYPLNIRITDEGDHDRRALLWYFDTAGVRNRWRRFRRTCFGMSAGNMVYGLFRAKALADAGGLRPVLIPDRLLMAEVALHGEFVQVPETLWYRRYIRLADLKRQASALFPDDAPSYLRVPWWLTHAGWIAHVYGRPASPLFLGRGRALMLASVYLSITLFLRAHRLVRLLFVRFRATVLRPIHKRYLVVKEKGGERITRARVRLGQLRIKLFWRLGIGAGRA